ncbi:hypothetical protein DFH06DRAFT_1477540 [Mycena polygramma]|nr:hypothetical protein DFH06DRAFT_1477540 [Mycena polygramma]
MRWGEQHRKIEKEPPTGIVQAQPALHQILLCGQRTCLPVRIGRRKAPFSSNLGLLTPTLTATHAVVHPRLLFSKSSPHQKRDDIPSPVHVDDWLPQQPNLHSTSQSTRVRRAVDEPDEDAFSSTAETDGDEQITRKKNKRLFSLPSDEDKEKPPKKKKALAGRRWSRGSGSVGEDMDVDSGSPVIDLTAEDTRSTPDFLRAVPKSPPAPANPPSPGRPETHHDPTLGDPYDKNATFEF